MVEGRMVKSDGMAVIVIPSPWQALTNEAVHEAQEYTPEHEACVPDVFVTHQHHAQEHEDDRVAGGTGKDWWYYSTGE